MKYEKLTVDGFIKRLHSGGYKSITGARRAIGKAQFSGDGKERARAEANKHFDAQPAADKAPRKKKVSPRLEKNPNSEFLSSIHILGEVVGTVSQAIAAMEKAKACSPKVNIDKGIQVAQEALTDSMEELRTSVLTPYKSSGKGNGVHREEVVSKFVQAAPAALGVSGIPKTGP